MPLGIIFKSEQKNDEMQEILDHLHQYVPMVTNEETVHLPGNLSACISHDYFHQLIFGKLCSSKSTSTYKTMYGSPLYYHRIL